MDKYSSLFGQYGPWSLLRMNENVKLNKDLIERKKKKVFERLRGNEEKKICRLILPLLFSPTLANETMKEKSC